MQATKATIIAPVDQLCLPTLAPARVDPPQDTELTRPVKRIGERLRKTRYHVARKPQPYIARPTEVYRAILELFRIGRVGLDDARQALDLVQADIDDTLAEEMPSWCDETSTNWAGTEWGR